MNKLGHVVGEWVGVIEFNQDLDCEMSFVKENRLNESGHVVHSVRNESILSRRIILVMQCVKIIDDDTQSKWCKDIFETFFYR